MNRASKAVVYCLGFLLLAELSLRAIAPEPRRLAIGWLEADQVVSFALGTSRTMRAVAPRVVEQTLRASGHEEAWVANVSRKGATMVGLYRLYMKTIHPLATDIPCRGVVAIEIRGAGLNDANLPARESRELSLDDAGWTWEALWSALGIDGVARVALGRLAIVQARDWLFLPRTTASTAPAMPTWAQGEKGWIPFDVPLAATRSVQVVRDRHRSRLLKDFRVGGLQSEFLVRLVRQIRDDGFEPVAYTMPITEVHRSFYDPGQYQAVGSHLSALSEREGFAFVDLDARHGLEAADFHDTSHLAPRAARDFSARFAREVLRPYLPTPSGSGVERCP